jgi:hypothetical protein
MSAIERDSSYADPYAGLADAYLTSLSSASPARPETELCASDLGGWARSRSTTSPPTLTLSFAISLWWQSNWRGGARAPQGAELKPGNATAHNWCPLPWAAWVSWRTR